MRQVNTNAQTANKLHPAGELEKLKAYEQQLRAAAQTASNPTQQGNIAEALGQLQIAKTSLENMIQQERQLLATTQTSQVNKERQGPQSIKAASEEIQSPFAAQIAAIRGIQGPSIGADQVFDSFPGYKKYMSTNINALDALLASKA